MSDNYGHLADPFAIYVAKFVLISRKSRVWGMSVPAAFGRVTEDNLNLWHYLRGVKSLDITDRNGVREQVAFYNKRFEVDSQISAVGIIFALAKLLNIVPSALIIMSHPGMARNSVLSTTSRIKEDPTLLTAEKCQIIKEFFVEAWARIVKEYDLVPFNPEIFTRMDELAAGLKSERSDIKARLQQNHEVIRNNREILLNTLVTNEPRFFQLQDLHCVPARATPAVKGKQLQVGIMTLPLTKVPKKAPSEVLEELEGTLRRYAMLFDLSKNPITNAIRATHGKGKEVARILGVSPATVSSRIAKGDASLSLREILDLIPILAIDNERLEGRFAEQIITRRRMEVFKSKGTLPLLDNLLGMYDVSRADACSVYIPTASGPGISVIASTLGKDTPLTRERFGNILGLVEMLDEAAQKKHGKGFLRHPEDRGPDLAESVRRRYEVDGTISKKYTLKALNTPYESSVIMERERQLVARVYPGFER